MKNFLTVFFAILIVSINNYSQIDLKRIKTENSYLIPNKGQLITSENKIAEEVIFYFMNLDIETYVRKSGASYVVKSYNTDYDKNSFQNNLANFNQSSSKKVRLARVDFDLEGANIKVENVIYEDPLPFYNNFYYSHCPQGIEYVQCYKKARIVEIYPGIDWIWKIDEKGILHYEFEVKPGANPDQIKIKFKGTDVEILNNGTSISLSTPFGKIIDGEIYAYDQSGRVFPRYSLKDGFLTYDFNGYKHKGALIIDPPLQLVWSTLLGANNKDYVYSIVFDDLNNHFIIGCTDSPLFPKENPGGGAYMDITLDSTDVFIFKLNSQGNLVWSTFYGGSGYDAAFDAIIKSNKLYIAGRTRSSDFPLQQQSGSFFRNAFAVEEAFLISFTTNGVREWATFFGGNHQDIGCFLEKDTKNNIYFIGITQSSDILITVPSGSSAYSKGQKNGAYDLFITRFDENCQLDWSTYFGGNDNESLMGAMPYAYYSGKKIKIDKNDNIFIVGKSGYDQNFPFMRLNNDAYYKDSMSGPNDYVDGFILSFNDSLQLRWSTLFGGEKADYIEGIDMDNEGNIYITGSTFSASNFPLQKFSDYCYYQNEKRNASDKYQSFITKFDKKGVVKWSTYYGGSNGLSIGKAIKVDNRGNIFIAGMTGSNDFPLLSRENAYYDYTDPTNSLICYLLEFSTSGVRKWATFYGRYFGVIPYCLVVDNAGDIYVGGYTGCLGVGDDIPIVGTKYKRNNISQENGFIAQFEKDILPWYILSDNAIGLYRPIKKGDTVVRYLKFSRKLKHEGRDFFKINWYNELDNLNLISITKSEGKDTLVVLNDSIIYKIQYTGINADTFKYAGYVLLNYDYFDFNGIVNFQHIAPIEFTQYKFDFDFDDSFSRNNKYNKLKFKFNINTPADPDVSLILEKIYVKKAGDSQFIDSIDVRIDQQNEFKYLQNGEFVWDISQLSAFSNYEGNIVVKVEYAVKDRLRETYVYGDIQGYRTYNQPVFHHFEESKEFFIDKKAPLVFNLGINRTEEDSLDISFECADESDTLIVTLWQHNDYYDRVGIKGPISFKAPKASNNSYKLYVSYSIPEQQQLLGEPFPKEEFYVTVDICDKAGNKFLDSISRQNHTRYKHPIYRARNLALAAPIDNSYMLFIPVKVGNSAEKFLTFRKLKNGYQTKIKHLALRAPAKFVKISVIGDSTINGINDSFAVKLKYQALVGDFTQNNGKFVDTIMLKYSASPYTNEEYQFLNIEGVTFDFNVKNDTSVGKSNQKRFLISLNAPYKGIKLDSLFYKKANENFYVNGGKILVDSRDYFKSLSNGVFTWDVSSAAPLAYYQGNVEVVIKYRVIDSLQGQYRVLSYDSLSSKNDDKIFETTFSDKINVVVDRVAPLITAFSAQRLAPAKGIAIFSARDLPGSKLKVVIKDDSTAAILAEKYVFTDASGDVNIDTIRLNTLNLAIRYISFEISDEYGNANVDYKKIDFRYINSYPANNAFKLIPPVKFGDSLIVNFEIFRDEYNSELSKIQITNFVLNTNNLFTVLDDTSGSKNPLSESNDKFIRKIKFKAPNYSNKSFGSGQYSFNSYIKGDNTPQAMTITYEFEALTYNFKVAYDSNYQAGGFLSKNPRLLFTANALLYGLSIDSILYKKPGEATYTFSQNIISDYNNLKNAVNLPYIWNTDNHSNLNGYEGKVELQIIYKVKDSLTGNYSLDRLRPWLSLKFAEPIIYRFEEKILVNFDKKNPSVSLIKAYRYNLTNAVIKFNASDFSKMRVELLKGTDVVSFKLGFINKTDSFVVNNIGSGSVVYKLRVTDAYGNETILDNIKIESLPYVADNSFALFKPQKTGSTFDKKLKFYLPAAFEGLDSLKINLPINYQIYLGVYALQHLIQVEHNGKNVLKTTQDTFIITFRYQPQDNRPPKDAIKGLFAYDYWINNVKRSVSWDFYIEGLSYIFDVTYDPYYVDIPGSNIKSKNTLLIFDMWAPHKGLVLGKLLYKKTNETNYLESGDIIINGKSKFKEFVRGEYIWQSSSLDYFNDYEGNVDIKINYKVIDSLVGKYRNASDPFNPIAYTQLLEYAYEQNIQTKIDKKSPRITYFDAKRISYNRGAIAFRGEDLSERLNVFIYQDSIMIGWKYNVYVNNKDTVYFPLPTLANSKIKFVLEDEYGNRTTKDTLIGKFKFLCDYNDDNTINAYDLGVFVQAWDSNDTAKADIWPVEGEYPYVRKKGDRNIDIKDLNVFVRMWDIAKKQGLYKSSLANEEHIKMPMLTDYEIIYSKDNIALIPSSHFKGGAIRSYGIIGYLNNAKFDSISALRNGIALSYFNQESNVFYLDFASYKEFIEDGSNLLKIRLNAMKEEDSLIIVITGYSDKSLAGESESMTKVYVVKSHLAKPKIIPLSYELYQNYPNPFNPRTTITFDLPEPTKVKLAIYDITGKEVMTLVNGYYEAGRYEIELDCDFMKSGVYFYGISSDKFYKVRKMVLLK